MAKVDLPSSSGMTSISTSSLNRINPVVATNFKRNASASEVSRPKLRSPEMSSLIFVNRSAAERSNSGGTKSASLARQKLSGAAKHVFGLGGRWSDLKGMNSDMQLNVPGLACFVSARNKKPSHQARFFQRCGFVAAV